MKSPAKETGILMVVIVVHLKVYACLPKTYQVLYLKNYCFLYISHTSIKF